MYKNAVKIFVETDIEEFPAALMWMVAYRNLIYQPQYEIPKQ